MNTRDIFICHASEDKNKYVRPFTEALRTHGITYWVDEAEIKWGDKLIKKINEGLAISRYVVVFLSPSFINKNWPQTELEFALNNEIASGTVIVLPLLIAPEEIIFKQYPLLRDKRYLRWGGSIDDIIVELAGLLGREFKKEWIYCPSASCTGKVWTRVIVQPDNLETLHEYVIRWGPWEYKAILSFDGNRCISLVYTKGDDGLSVPIFFSISPPCFVQFGQGEPLDDHILDVNYGWCRVE